MNLFSEIASELNDTLVPPGLRYWAGFVSLDEEAELVAWIDLQSWDCELARRVQHYGWRYDYRARAVFPEDRIGPLPGPLRELADRMLESGLVSERMDQAIINEYLAGQGIAPHVDCEPCFGEEIGVVSLLDSYPMEFAEISGCADAPDFDGSTTLAPLGAAKGGNRVEVWLERGSSCVISGPVRHVWTHGIAKRRSDLVVGGGRRLRGRRVSVTFRRVVLG